MNILQKRLRAEVIRDFIKAAGLKGAVCFSSGTSSRELITAGVDLVDVSPLGDMVAVRWWTPEKIARIFPDRIDATSGHLAIHLLAKIADKMRQEMQTPKDGTEILTGSGETLLTMTLAFPGTRFIAIAGLGKHTREESEAPLHSFIQRVNEKNVQPEDARVAL